MASSVPKLQSFSEVLAAAIRDFEEHGYDSDERVEFWVRLLREATARSLTSPTVAQEQLRQGLGAIYRRMVERGEMLAQHPGVARFTLNKVKPQLRAELDRRIMASASLIRLNREEAIEKTLRRFRGWSTSIPKGGSGAVDKAKEKASLKKALSQLPFEERRVHIDQGHKLTASLSEVLATDGGAIAAVWKSRWRQAGYDYREDHKERDGNVYLMRGNWASEKGLVKPGDAGWYDEITSAGEEPFCRCSIKWIYNLRDLPKDMLTKKGKDALAAVRMAA